MEHLRDLQKHKINIYIENAANLKTHLCDLVLMAQNYLVSALVLSFDSLWNRFTYGCMHHNNTKKQYAHTFVHNEHTNM